jgi:hypothetical protein
MRTRPQSTSKCLLTCLGLVASLALSVACSNGGGGGSPAGGSSAANEGSVAILLTDGPVDPNEFKEILITYTEIILIGGPKGNVTIFRGNETIDLRDFEDVGKIATVGRRVPAGCYEKIRLEVSEIELVPANGDPSVFPKLPPKIDFNPQGEFCVRKGRLLLVQVDFEAGNSIHFVETGNGKFIVRPVILADIISIPFPGKLVLLEGVVEEMDRQNDTFLLCDTHSVNRPGGGDRETEDERNEGDPDDRDDFCVEIEVDDDTSFFDQDGDSMSFDDLREGDDASVLGRFRRVSGEDLIFLAEVVQVGSPLAIDGVVLTEVDSDDQFEMEIEPGQGYATGFELLVELQDGSKIFRRNGAPLTPEDIEIDDRVRSVGVLVDDPELLLKASVVIVDMDHRDGRRISGDIVDVQDAGRRIEVDTGDIDECVDVPDEAEILRVTVDDDGAETERIDRSDLEVGDDVTVFGKPNGCLQAMTVVVFVDETTD